eukprot:5921851-Prymnesium_polylepis.1
MIGPDRPQRPRPRERYLVQLPPAVWRAGVAWVRMVTGTPAGARPAATTIARSYPPVPSQASLN